METIGDRTRTHGLSKHPLYFVRNRIKSACKNPKYTDYPNYGGRGIKICSEWDNDFLSFYNWAMENGYKDGLQIDRIDNDGNYNPLNCRWVTCQENLMNKRNTLFYEYNGDKKTLQEWAIESGIPYKRLRARIKECGWDFEKAITKPVRLKNKRKEVI
jgi:hypothetical protein